MIGSIHPLVAIDIARADIAARVRDAEKHAVAAARRRELRAARAEVRHARRIESRAAGHRRPVRHVARFIHGLTA